MITYINSKLLPSITPIIIFCFILLSGCSSGNNVQTVDNEELYEKIDDVQTVYNFKLKDGTFYSDNLGNISLSKWNTSNPIMIYSPYSFKNDSTEINSKDQKIMEFSLNKIKSAKVKLKEREYATVWNVLGGIVILGLVLLFLFINTNRK